LEDPQGNHQLVQLSRGSGLAEMPRRGVCSYLAFENFQHRLAYNGDVVARQRADWQTREFLFGCSYAALVTMRARIKHT
jgi:hypothetical protein